MHRYFALPCLFFFFCGCAEPGDNVAGKPGVEGQSSGVLLKTEAGPESQAKIRRFADELQQCLIKKDWDTLVKLHWSGAGATAAGVKRDFEYAVDATGEISGMEIRFVGFDQSDYDEYVDAEEIKGPMELLRGKAEIALIQRNDPDSGTGLIVNLFVGEENDKFVALEFTEIGF